MNTIRTLIVAAATLVATCQPASAHFLWAEVKPGPQPQFQVRFSEGAWEKTTADLLPRIAPARARLAGGQALVLKPGDGSQVASLPAGTTVAGASQVWGVLDRTAEGRGIFLLEYSAKAAATPEAAGEKVGLHFEVFAKRQGNDWVASVRHGARPEVGAVVTVTTPDGQKVADLKTDAKGEARFSLKPATACAILAAAEEKENGTFEGKSFELKRYYATLVFPLNPVVSTATTATAAREGRTMADPDGLPATRYGASR